MIAMQSQSAFRVMLSVKDRSFQIESVTRVQKVVPPSAPVEGTEEQYGTWFAVEDAKGRMIYRRLMDNFLVEGVEVFTGDKREFQRVRAPGTQRILSLLVPEIPGADVLSVHASDVEKGRASAAKPVFKVNMRQLAELAAKGGSTHGR
jgi:hypothetical protein